MKKSLSWAGIALAGALALSACSNGDTPGNGGEEVPTFPEGSTMAEIQAAGKLVVGTKFDQPLFGLKPPVGDPEGFDVEIAKIIAAELGVTAEFVETASPNREPFLENGNVDIVVATYTINDNRKQIVHFAGPYYVAGQDALVLAGNTDVTSAQDLVGKDVCTVPGTTSMRNLEELGALVTVTFETYSQCLPAVRSGQVVALSTDDVILAGLAAQNPGEFKVVGDQFSTENYGIGVNQSRADLVVFINDLLDEIYKDGRYKAAWDATIGDNLPYVNPPAVDRYLK